jgi:catechol 2,3-dioxygenase-like lactoylglutathione lyase family enzyme
MHVMPTFHHANLGIPPDLEEAEADFLVGILGYRRLEPPKAAADFGARWFEADDGTQVHLSLDPDHSPAAMAHIALEVGDDSEAIATRLSDAGVRFKAAEFDGNRIVLCKDPAGNRWELRG